VLSGLCRLLVLLTRFICDLYTDWYEENCVSGVCYCL
jgi:hypothetical protein